MAAEYVGEAVEGEVVPDGVVDRNAAGAKRVVPDAAVGALDIDKRDAERLERRNAS